MGYPVIAALFIGAALTATSVGVTARVLKDMGLLRRADARLVIGAAVIDDMLGPLVLAVVIGLTASGADMLKVLVVLAEIAVFVGFEVWVAPRLVRRHAHLVEGLRTPNAPFVVAVVIMLGTAALAEWIGTRRGRRGVPRRHDARRDRGPLLHLARRPRRSSTGSCRTSSR